MPKHYVELTPWGRSYASTSVNGHEAHLLLFLLDDYLDGLQSGRVREMDLALAEVGFDNLDELASLRNRLFNAHEHTSKENETEESEE